MRLITCGRGTLDLRQTCKPTCKEGNQRGQAPASPCWTSCSTWGRERVQECCTCLHVTQLQDRILKNQPGHSPLALHTTIRIIPTSPHPPSTSPLSIEPTYKETHIQPRLHEFCTHICHVALLCLTLTLSLSLSLSPSLCISISAFPSSLSLSLSLSPSLLSNPLSLSLPLPDSL